MSTVLGHAEVCADCSMHDFVVGKLRFKVKAFTALITLERFVQVSVHVLLQGAW